MLGLAFSPSCECSPRRMLAATNDATALQKRGFAFTVYRTADNSLVIVLMLPPTLEGAGLVEARREQAKDVIVIRRRARDQGLTFVHFSAQLMRFLRDRRYIWGLSRGYVGCVRSGSG